MNARHLIERSAYGPTTIRVMGQAFDGAWREIEGRFGDDPACVQTARLNLASAVLSACPEESRDVEAIKSDALNAMTFGRRWRQRVG